MRVGVGCARAGWYSGGATFLWVLFFVSFRVGGDWWQEFMVGCGIALAVGVRGAKGDIQPPESERRYRLRCATPRTPRRSLLASAELSNNGKGTSQESSQQQAVSPAAHARRHERLARTSTVHTPRRATRRRSTNVLSLPAGHVCHPIGVRSPPRGDSVWRLPQTGLLEGGRGRPGGSVPRRFLFAGEIWGDLV